MRIGFIGAGKVATVFGRYLFGHGEKISGYYDRHADKAAHAGQATGSQAFSSDLQAAARSDILLITTRDDQIADACAGLCRQQAIESHQLVGHMSGAHASDILEPARQRGAAVFSLHPLQAFAREDRALADLPRTYFSLESPDPRADVLEKLLIRTGNPYFRIAPEHKSLYHLAACIFSNYLVTLVDFGLTTLEKSGIRADAGFEAMLPLIHGSLANISAAGTTDALTGPIARGDVGTLERHLLALRGSGSVELEAFYTFLGLSTLPLAARNERLTTQKIEAIQNLFKGRKP